MVIMYHLGSPTIGSEAPILGSEAKQVQLWFATCTVQVRRSFGMCEFCMLMRKAAQLLFLSQFLFHSSQGCSLCHPSFMLLQCHYLSNRVTIAINTTTDIVILIVKGTIPSLQASPSSSSTLAFILSTIIIISPSWALSLSVPKSAVANPNPSERCFELPGEDWPVVCANTN